MLTLAFGLGLNMGGGGSSVDADAAAWAAAVTANGGTYSPATLAAVSAFAAAAKASGYWTKLNRINLFCGNQLAAALVPLKAGGGSPTETNVNFVGGDYSEATGLTGNASTKYLRTGLIPSASLSLNDQHYALYNRSSAASGATAIATMGTLDGTNRTEFDAPFSDGVIYYQINTPVQVVVSGTTPYGHLVAVRSGATAQAAYRNGASVSTSANASNALPTTELYVLAFNNNGAQAFPSGAPVGAYSIGSGLTGSDAAAYYTHMQAFQTALGRNV